MMQRENPLGDMPRAPSASAETEAKTTKVGS